MERDCRVDFYEGFISGRYDVKKIIMSLVLGYRVYKTRLFGFYDEKTVPEKIKMKKLVGSRILKKYTHTHTLSL